MTKVFTATIIIFTYLQLAIIEPSYCLLRSSHFQPQIEEESGRIQIKVEITFVLIDPFQ